MIVAPNSPSPRANESDSPAASPRRDRGRITRKKVLAGPAPSVRAAATRFWSIASNVAIACRMYSGLDTYATAMTTAVWVSPSWIPNAFSCSPSSPNRPKAAISPIPATAGGRTSGSSTSTTSSERPRKRRVARRYAVGVPSRSTSACAIALVFRLTTSASVTTGRESWATRSVGETRAKIATIGNSKKPSATAAAANTPALPSARRISVEPAGSRPCAALSAPAW